jgi:phosphate transport system permease protein
MRRLFGGAALLAGGIVVLIGAFLVFEALPALRSVGLLRFFSDDGWLPSAGPEGRFNLFPMLWGTVLLSAGALFLAAPAGLMSALFCRFYAPPFLARYYRRLIELLAGVPSVVYGFWALVTLVPRIHEVEPPGQSLLAGILILALMVLPTVALFAESALRAVPQSYLAGAAALGMGRWATVRGIVLPAAAPGIATGILLALTRALGETMAVLMVCGNVVQVPGSVFDPVRSLTSNIALEMSYATAHHRSALFVSGLTLMAMVALMMVVIEQLERRARLA